MLPTIIKYAILTYSRYDRPAGKRTTKLVELGSNQCGRVTDNSDVEVHRRAEAFAKAGEEVSRTAISRVGHDRGLDEQGAEQAENETDHVGVSPRQSGFDR